MSVFYVIGFVTTVTVLLYRLFVPLRTKPMRGLIYIPKTAEASSSINEKKDDYSYHLDSLPGGDFAELGYGKTRYYLMGDEKSGKRIVLLHGIGTASIAWRPIANGLVEKGYRVLVYDFWGRGYSDCPGVVYDDKLFVAQLYMLLSHVGWKSCQVCGWSLGGAVAAVFAKKFPSKVERLVLIAPAGLVQKIPLAAKLVRSDIFGEVIMHTVGPWVMKKELKRLNNHTADYLLKYPDAKVLPQLLLDHLKYSEGFLRAYHSSLTHFPLGSMQEDYRQLGKVYSGPIEIVWGRNDKIVPYNLSAELISFVPQAKLHTISDGSHDIVVTHVQQCLKWIHPSE